MKEDVQENETFNQYLQRKLNGYTTKSGATITCADNKITYKMNIYDFAGNEFEMILNHALSDPLSPCTRVGGNYLLTGDKYPASYRSYLDAIGNNSYNTFRATFY